MLHITVVAVMISLDLVSQAPAKASTWVMVESKEGGFSFSMPTKPIEQMIEVPSPIGKVKAKLYICPVQDSALIVQQMSLPASVPASNVAAELEAAKKAAAANMPKSVSEKKIKAGPYPDWNS